MSQRSAAARLWYALVWCVCWVVGRLVFRFRFTGRGHVPKNGPVLLAANHQSYLDPALVGIACPRQISALARHELFFWPLGPLIRSLGAVPIDRTRGGIAGFKQALKLLRSGETMLVFPEGTRTPDGRLQPFQPGFGLLARRSGATIVPVAIKGAFDAMPRSRALPRSHPIRLIFAEPITREQVAELTDQQLAAVLCQRIRDAMRADSRIN